ncbi:MAG: glutamyl-tRNA reductase [Dehalococcoidia bacterium]|nr:MAG: glutamyl-tRNA reductase [Dehalococcoidia bacterium]
MQVCVVGVNHKTTPVAIRGKLAIGASQLQHALLSLHNYVLQGIILCTCNRTEVYTLAEKGSTPELASINFLNARANLPQEDLLQHIYVYHDEIAVKHLFQVASGLDSMIIGEYEILGQVRRALEEAEKSRLAGLPLLSLFRHAVRVGRHIRAETGISKNALSVSSVAVDLVAQVVGDIRHCKIVVIGAGEAGRLVAKACRERGASQIVVVSRSREKGSDLAAMLHGIWVPMENLGQELDTCDIVISCSGAPHTVLKLELVEEVMSTRPQHPLVIIDIAVPQDVESQVRQLNNVFLYDIDELTKVGESNHKLRQNEIQCAMQIVDDEVERFITYWQELEAKPVISALVRKAENIRQAQLGLTLKKLPELSDEERAHLEAMTKAIVQKILRDPIQCLKSNTGKREEYTRVINELFRLDGKKPK